MTKMLTKMLVAVAPVVLIAGPSFAQGRFLFGQTLPDLDWRQIRTDSIHGHFLSLKGLLNPKGRNWKRIMVLA